jgi:hypothetical protein
LPAEGFEPPTYGLQNRCTTTVLSRHGTSPRQHFTAGRPCSGNLCAREARRLLHRASNQVDPQHVVVFAAGVALCVPALLTVKLVHRESEVCGALIGVAVMLNVLAVGTVIVTV